MAGIVCRPANNTCGAWGGALVEEAVLYAVRSVAGVR